MPRVTSIAYLISRAQCVVEVWQKKIVMTSNNRLFCVVNTKMLQPRNQFWLIWLVSQSSRVIMDNGVQYLVHVGRTRAVYSFFIISLFSIAQSVLLITNSMIFRDIHEKIELIDEWNGSINDIFLWSHSIHSTQTINWFSLSSFHDIWF